MVGLYCKTFISDHVMKSYNSSLQGGRALALWGTRGPGNEVWHEGLERNSCMKAAHAARRECPKLHVHSRMVGLHCENSGSNDMISMILLQHLPSSIAVYWGHGKFDLFFGSTGLKPTVNEGRPLGKKSVSRAPWRALSKADLGSRMCMHRITRGKAPEIAVSRACCTCPRFQVCPGGMLSSGEVGEAGA